MVTLALDTAGVDRTTVALCGSEGYLAGASISASPAEQLVPQVTQLLQQARLAMSDIDEVVVGVGPGPFTGLRIGLAHAHAMSHALGVPVRGVSSLAAVAAAAAQSEFTDFLVATDARRKEVYCARVRNGVLESDSVAVLAPLRAVEMYQGLPVLGDGAVKYAHVFTDADCILTDAPMDYARGLGTAVMQAKASNSLLPPAPAYLREPDAVPSVVAASVHLGSRR